MLIKFKPFLSEKDRPLKGDLCVFDIQDNFITTKDNYTFEEEDLETGNYVSRKVDTNNVYLRAGIIDLGYYWADNEKGYFLNINGTCWGFTDRAEGLAIYNTIKDWLCK